MAKVNISKKAELEDIQGKRLQFLELVAVNPNYFGTLLGSEFQPVLEISNDTFYEQVTCLGFNPSTNVLEAVVQVKQASGYDGSLCQTGSYEYVRFFGLTKERAQRLKPHCLIMHPGPINRGVEIDSDLADGPQSVILDQVANGLAVRMAVLYLCSTAARKQR